MSNCLDYKLNTVKVFTDIMKVLNGLTLSKGDYPSNELSQSAERSKSRVAASLEKKKSIESSSLPLLKVCPVALRLS